MEEKDDEINRNERTKSYNYWEKRKKITEKKSL